MSDASVKVTTELAPLKAQIPVPEGVQLVRWGARPKGAPGLGPTDLELMAWFAVTDPDTLHAALGEALGPYEVAGPVALLSAVVPGSERVAGTRYPASAFENIRWTGGAVVEHPDGLLVHLHSR